MRATTCSTSSGRAALSRHALDLTDLQPPQLVIPVVASHHEDAVREGLFELCVNVAAATNVVRVRSDSHLHGQDLADHPKPHGTTEVRSSSITSSLWTSRAVKPPSGPTALSLGHPSALGPFGAVGHPKAVRHPKPLARTTPVPIIISDHEEDDVPIAPKRLTLKRLTRPTTNDQNTLPKRHTAARCT